MSYVSIYMLPHSMECVKFWVFQAPIGPVVSSPIIANSLSIIIRESPPEYDRYQTPFLAV